MVYKSGNASTRHEKIAVLQYHALPFPLLRLPLEVKRVIYNFMLDLSWNEHLNFLCVSRQILLEARESYSRRPLACGSPDQLASFAKVLDPTSLSAVRHLSLQLEDIKPSEMQDFLSMIVTGAKVSWRDSPYHRMTQLVSESLAKMGNIQTLELLPAEGTVRQPPTRFIDTILYNVANSLPDLRCLNLGFEHSSLVNLQKLKRLRKLILTGFSRPGDYTTAEALGNLPRLTDLIVTGRKASHRKFKRCRHRACVSLITPHLLRKLRPLQKLELHDHVNGALEDHVFITTDNLLAVEERHKATLKALRLVSNKAPSEKLLSLLESLIDSSRNLQHISLEFPKRVPLIIDSI